MTKLTNKTVSALIIGLNAVLLSNPETTERVLAAEKALKANSTSGARIPQELLAFALNCLDVWAQRNPTPDKSATFERVHTDVNSKHGSVITL